MMPAGPLLFTAMGVSVRVLLLVVAALCFILAACGVPQSGRVNLVALGLFFWVLSILVS
jgi:hypothetical protein